MLLLVETQCSMMDVWEINPSNTTKLAGPMASEARPATLGHFSRVIGLVQSITDGEAESQRSRRLQSKGRQKRGLEVFIEIEESQVAD